MQGLKSQSLAPNNSPQSGNSVQVKTNDLGSSLNPGPKRYRRKTLADFAKSGIQKKEEARQALFSELASKLELSENQIESIVSFEDRVAKRELLLLVLGKSFSAVRRLASVMCNLQHKLNTALNHLLLPGQLESFLKTIYMLRHAVEEIDLLKNGPTREDSKGTIGI